MIDPFVVAIGLHIGTLEDPILEKIDSASWALTTLTLSMLMIGETGSTIERLCDLSNTGSVELASVNTLVPWFVFDW
ncbi:hypothetical protein WICPIJ_008063 [Wickerhamomyces pijperi]|uniref:Uncharacterized protein n=1 Tax=Wickerhamomyces pijperi TaxID=599730 RepID=A0A9P8Q0D1_WICPI|nr:hypothetical protein WICPIJ_008063 [Wickerhamomyces pijperi]